MKNKLILFWLVLLAVYFIQAQFNPSQEEQIDELFKEWNQPNHPGGAVGVMQNGKLTYSKAFGLSSLEYLVPNSTGTQFNIASVSKQFTGMGIVLLEQQGKLSLDDDIRKYLDWLPDFGTTITIRQCLNHTSGLRSLHAMLVMAGWRDDDSRDNVDLVRFMKRQKELNFKPGDEYLYCNTGYILLAELIEEITEQSFPAYMKNEVFDPLGMAQTYVEDNYSRVVPNNATSYYVNNNGSFDRAVEYWGYVGSGNIHSSIGDLSLWLANFSTPETGWEKAFERMESTVPFNNGNANDYALGVNIGKNLGRKTISHGGAIGGFRSYAVHYPEEKTSIVVLTNFSQGNAGGKANEIARILWPQKQANNEQIAEDPPINKLNGIKVNRRKLGGYAAEYWSEESFLLRKIYVKDDTLIYARSAENETKLVPFAKDRFHMLIPGNQVEVKFTLGKNGQKEMLVIEDNGNYQTSFKSLKSTNPDLDQFVGSYYSPELDVKYRIYVSENELKGHHTRHGEFDIKAIHNDALEGSIFAFPRIKVVRDENEAIKGFHVSNGRVRNMWFEKMK